MKPNSTNSRAAHFKHMLTVFGSRVTTWTGFSAWQHQRCTCAAALCRSTRPPVTNSSAHVSFTFQLHQRNKQTEEPFTLRQLIKMSQQQHKHPPELTSIQSEGSNLQQCPAQSPKQAHFFLFHFMFMTQF